MIMEDGRNIKERTEHIFPTNFSEFLELALLIVADQFSKLSTRKKFHHGRNFLEEELQEI